jgi:XTP/dITP diphosphohydrolase
MISAPEDTSRSRTIVAATTNPGKLREIRTILGEASIEVLGLDAFPPIPEPEETGDTFEANARLKALHYAAHTQRLTVAEDSGLEIDALDGEPGVRSARFLGTGASYHERFAEIFRRLNARPERPRTARFVAALSVVDRGNILFETRGTIEGEIAAAPRGEAGFGYDPIFFYPPYGCTLAEVTEKQKIAVAHRGHAFRALAAWLARRN